MELDEQSAMCWSKSKAGKPSTEDEMKVEFEKPDELETGAETTRVVAACVVLGSITVKLVTVPLAVVLSTTVLVSVACEAEYELTGAVETALPVAREVTGSNEVCELASDSRTEEAAGGLLDMSTVNGVP